MYQDHGDGGALRTLGQPPDIPTISSLLKSTSVTVYSSVVDFMGVDFPHMSICVVRPKYPPWSTTTEAAVGAEAMKEGIYVVAEDENWMKAASEW